MSIDVYISVQFECMMYVCLRGENKDVKDTEEKDGDMTVYPNAAAFTSKYKTVFFCPRRYLFMRKSKRPHWNYFT